MHTYDIPPSPHDHLFNQDQARPGERRTLIIVVITAIFMIVEIAAGLRYGSMALLADGLHMASHAVALGMSVAAYVYARQHAADRRFSFGTGKVNSLAAFASAILLGGFAVLMAVESIERLINPVTIRFDQAILVAVIGLLVNGASAWLLASTPHHHHHHHHHHHSENADSQAPTSELSKDHNAAYLDVLADALTSPQAIIAPLANKLRRFASGTGAWLLASISHHHKHDDRHDLGHHYKEHVHPEAPASELQKDHNLHAAYLHVLADALTSLLAIVALLAGKYTGTVWLDPVMGVIGAILVAHWSWGLLGISAKVLLDWQAEDAVVCQLREALLAHKSDGITDLHIWVIGQGQHAAEVTIVTDQARGPAYYKALIPDDLGIVHATIEVHHCSPLGHGPM